MLSVKRFQILETFIFKTCLKATNNFDTKFLHIYRIYINTDDKDCVSKKKKIEKRWLTRVFLEVNIFKASCLCNYSVRYHEIDH